MTDAHVVLGQLPADHPLGGLGRLDVDAAREAVQRIAGDLGLSVEEAALGILEVADSAMERAIRLISVERGHDPRDYSLLAFGGAGPLHAVSLARRLAIPRVILPAAAGVLSALGLLAAEIGHDLSQGLIQRLDATSPAALEEVLARLRRRGERELRADGVRPEAMRFLALADLRYLGQSHEITVPLPSAGEVSDVRISAETAFHEEHRRRYGHAAPGAPVELVSLRVRATAAAQAVSVVPQGVGEAIGSHRQPAWFDRRGPVETNVLSRRSLGPGDRVAGPAVLLGDDATALVPPGVEGRVDSCGSLVLEVPR